MCGARAYVRVCEKQRKALSINLTSAVEICADGLVRMIRYDKHMQSVPCLLLHKRTRPHHIAVRCHSIEVSLADEE